MAFNPKLRDYIQCRLFNLLSIILLSSPFSYFLAMYPLMMWMEVLYKSALYPEDKLKYDPSRSGHSPLKVDLGVAILSDRRFLPMISVVVSVVDSIEAFYLIFSVVLLSSFFAFGLGFCHSVYVLSFFKY